MTHPVSCVKFCNKICLFFIFIHLFLKRKTRREKTLFVWKEIVFAVWWSKQFFGLIAFNLHDQMFKQFRAIHYLYWGGQPILANQIV